MSDYYCLFIKVFVTNNKRRDEHLSLDNLSLSALDVVETERKHPLSRVNNLKKLLALSSFQSVSCFSLASLEGYVCRKEQTVVAPVFSYKHIFLIAVF